MTIHKKLLFIGFCLINQNSIFGSESTYSNSQKQRIEIKAQGAQDHARENGIDNFNNLTKTTGGKIYLEILGFVPQKPPFGTLR